MAILFTGVYIYARMHAISVTFIVLSLSILLEASSRIKNDLKRISVESSPESSSQQLPQHILLQGIQIIPANEALISQISGPHGESMKSLSVRNDALKPFGTDLSVGEKRKASAKDYENKSSSSSASSKDRERGHDSDKWTKGENLALEALLTLSKSENDNKLIDKTSQNVDGSVDTCISTQKVKRTKNPKAEKEVVQKVIGQLSPMTERAFAHPIQIDFCAYFDESNIQTEGVIYLRRCLSESRSFNLGKFLIKNGARIPEDELCVFIVNIMENILENGISNNLIMEMIRVDPVGMIDLLSKTCIENVDFYLMSGLISDFETFAYLISCPDLIKLISLLIESKYNMINTLKLIFNNLAVPFEHDIVIDFFKKARENGNADFIELIFNLGLIKVDDRLKHCTLISKLFGKIPSTRIITFIKQFGYDLKYTHDMTENPNGDILLFAMAKRDLESFNELLKMGASIEVKLIFKSEIMTITEYSRIKYPEFYEAIQNHHFKERFR